MAILMRYAEYVAGYERMSDYRNSEIVNMFWCAVVSGHRSQLLALAAAAPVAVST